MRCGFKLVVACAAVAAACRGAKPAATGGLDDLLRAGQMDQALLIIETRLQAGKATSEDRDLHVALLSHLGRTPEAMDAYSARVDAGQPHDALLLEAVYLSSYPPGARIDPSAFAARGQRPPYGSSTHDAVMKLLGPGLKGQVQRARIADLVEIVALPGRNESLDALADFVEQKTEPSVRLVALMALPKVGTPEAVERIEGIAERFKSSTIMLRQILEILERIPDARPDLPISLLAHPNDRVRTVAAGVLARSKAATVDEKLLSSETVEARMALLARGKAPASTVDRVREHLAGISTPLEKSRFIDLIRAVGGSANGQFACELVSDDDLGVSTNAASVLIQITQEAGVPCIAKHVRSPDETMKRTVLRLLVDTPAPAHVKDIAAVVKAASAAGDPITAALGAAAIGRAGGPEAEQALAGILESSEPRVRASAAVALFHLGHDELEPVVEEAFLDTKGPWSHDDYTEWRLLAREPSEREMPLVGKAVTDGNPSLRDKALGGLMESLHPEAVFLLEQTQIKRFGETSLELRPPGSGKILPLCIDILDRMRSKGDAEGRHALLARLLSSPDLFLVAVGLRLLGPEDGSWAERSAMTVLRDGKDPWLRLEAVRALAQLVAAREPAGKAGP